ncbi:MAG: DDE-type integrase/transposase/recombinase [Planctomycetota bacterium]
MSGTGLRNSDNHEAVNPSQHPDQSSVGKADPGRRSLGITASKTDHSVQSADDTLITRVFYKPPGPHEVWHLDLTQLRVLWRRYEVATVVDGFSRKIVAVQAYQSTPETLELIGFIDQTIQSDRKPKFFTTDCGGQFQQRFRALLHERGIEHARGRPRTWKFNAKVERLFWSLKRWNGGGLVVPKLDLIQRRLDGYRTWHNLFRPYAALDTLTPHEANRRL